MEINFFRGNDHQERFRFKTFTGEIEKMYFAVKCKNKHIRIKKSLDNGIEFADDWYVVTFVPSDTENLPCDLEMVYGIKIVTNGKKYTVQKGAFNIEDEVVTSDCEV